MADPVILEKLDSLQRCVARIRQKTPASADALLSDLDLQDIVALNLERAIQTCVDVAARFLAQANVPPPDTMAEGFDELFRLGILPEALAGRMKKAVGFRNIAVHAYRRIDWNVVYALITTRLGDFADFASSVRKQ